ncbi:hypothetical protein GUJ93_ZPchr0002g24190 [Zizania palustris]|uniref:HMA domain-containing protein n=1 Tax=Zizania palustris TaxID=103762 RepID=A0A8J5RSA3_ZIZPA|nr:hypothetical protein GUJ93_ZPchr0002g24190 [Zizania palustris]
MAKQKFVLKLTLDSERKRRKAFKAAVGTSGVTSATMEGDKIIIIGDGVDPITLTTMLRRSLGNAELISISSADDKKKVDASMGFGGKEGKEGGNFVYGGQQQQPAVAPLPYFPYQQYNAVAPNPVYPSYPDYSQQDQDPSCSIM